MPKKIAIIAGLAVLLIAVGALAGYIALKAGKGMRNQGGVATAPRVQPQGPSMPQRPVNPTPSPPPPTPSPTQPQATSTQPQIDTSNWKTYRNEEYGFEVKYPGDWEVDSGALPIGFSSKDGTYSIQMSPTFLNKNKWSIERKAQYIREALKARVESEFQVKGGIGFKISEQTKGGDIPAALIAGRSYTFYIGYEVYDKTLPRYFQNKLVFDNLVSTFGFIR